MADVIEFSGGFKGSPADPENWMIGPFEYHQVMIDGRVIPRLTAYRDGDMKIGLVVDGRFSQSLPVEMAHGVAWLLANALAIGEGYSHLGAENKDMPFAPRGHELAALPEK